MITTVVGNFPKVAEPKYGTAVIGAINSWQKQELSDDGLEHVFQDVTRAVIKEQEEAGVDLLTDGQIRWEDLVTPLARKVEGFEINGLERFFDNNVYYRRPILRRTPVRRRPIFLGDYLFAKSCTTKPIKVVLPGPYTVVRLSEDRYYKNVQPFLRSIAEILNEEARALAQAGAMVIQFDEPALGFGRPPLKQVVEAINIATQGVKAKTALYTYFGSLNGAFGALQGCRVDLLGVDVVSDPKAIGAIKKQKRWTKELALGCLDARNTKLESVTELHALFDVVKKLVPEDRLYVNPNCGLEFLPYEPARQKLNRLVEAVRRYKSSCC
ncbi:MAG: hypothetical protein HYY91_01130 [Candidatus Omnitrophica bacterium]|nr:hypothetical protein [Candidatus Omnitrophota bacterium]